ncbi:MAG: hypothetical protein RLZZ524_1490, partial [Pseudomonadota bacterium]
YRAGRDAVRNSTTAQKAARSVWQMLEDNGLTLADARAAIRRIGDDASLGDISPGMQVEAAGTATADSGAQSTMAGRYGARDAGMRDRVTARLDEAFGPFTDPSVIDDSVRATKRSTGPAYRLAEQHIVDSENAIETIRQLQRTYRPNSDTGRQLQHYLDQLIDQNGNVIGEGNIVHGVRQEIDAALRSGNLPNGGPFRDVRDALDEVLKGQIPGFAEADATWSGAQRVQEAFDYGRQDVMSRNTYPGQHSRRWDRMQPPEREAARQGVRADLEMSTVSGAPNAGLKAERRLSQNMNELKVGPMIEEVRPGGFQRLRDGLDAEQTMRETNDLVQATRGSRTAPVGAAASRRWGTGGGGILDGLRDAAAQAATATAAGGPVAGIGSVIAQGASASFQRAIRAMTGVNPRVIAEAGDILSRMGPDAIRSVDQIEQVLRARGISADQARAIAGGVQRLIKGSVYVNATTGPMSGGGGR